MDWRKLVERYDRPHTLFYLDPPYWQVAGYGMKFDWHHYQRMRDLADEIEGQMIISINDHPEIRNLFADLHVTEIDHTYTVGGTDKAQKCTELVYTTYNPEEVKPQRKLL